MEVELGELCVFVVAANSRPPKPWERVDATSGPTPFKPPSAGNTSDVVESSGTANTGEISNQTTTGTVNTNALGRSLPTRPWEQTYATTNYGGKFDLCLEKVDLVPLPLIIHHIRECIYGLLINGPFFCRVVQNIRKTY